MAFAPPLSVTSPQLILKRTEQLAVVGGDRGAGESGVMAPFASPQWGEADLRTARASRVRRLGVQILISEPPHPNPLPSGERENVRTNMA
jgi:hypothetical protein